MRGGLGHLHARIITGKQQRMHFGLLLPPPLQVQHLPQPQILLERRTFTGRDTNHVQNVQLGHKITPLLATPRLNICNPAQQRLLAAASRGEDPNRTHPEAADRHRSRRVPVRQTLPLLFGPTDSRELRDNKSDLSACSPSIINAEPKE